MEYNSTPLNMLNSLPPVTRFWLIGSFSLTLVVSMDIISFKSILFYIPFIVEKFQIWRFFSSFFFFGKFSLNWFFQILMLTRFSTYLEVDPFIISKMGGSTDYLFSLFFIGIILLLLSWPLNLLTLSHSLLFGVIYLWSKRNSSIPINFWGFNFKGFHIPWLMIGFTILLGNSPISDLVGLIAAHIYFFLVHVFPIAYDYQIVNNPQWFVRIVEFFFNISLNTFSKEKIKKNSSRYSWNKKGYVLGRS